MMIPKKPRINTGVAYTVIVLLLVFSGFEIGRNSNHDQIPLSSSLIATTTDSSSLMEKAVVHPTDESRWTHGYGMFNYSAAESDKTSYVNIDMNAPNKFYFHIAVYVRGTENVGEYEGFALLASTTDHGLEFLSVDRSSIDESERATIFNLNCRVKFTIDLYNSVTYTFQEYTPTAEDYALIKKIDPELPVQTAREREDEFGTHTPCGYNIDRKGKWLNGIQHAILTSNEPGS